MYSCRAKVICRLPMQQTPHRLVMSRTLMTGFWPSSTSAKAGKTLSLRAVKQASASALEGRGWSSSTARRSCRDCASRIHCACSATKRSACSGAVRSGMLTATEPSRRTCRLSRLTFFRVSSYEMPAAMRGVTSGLRCGMETTLPPEAGPRPRRQRSGHSPRLPAPRGSGAGSASRPGR